MNESQYFQLVTDPVASFGHTDQNHLWPINRKNPCARRTFFKDTTRNAR